MGAKAYSVNVDGKLIEVRAGERFMSRGRTFAVCGVCGKIVRIKPLFGGMHICE